jgi:6-pyruvoyltetrahydropterin/6-carboxytetrahydropterin synthase
MALEPANAQGFGDPLMWELTKSFRFEAAHALAGTTLGDAGAEVHGHSYRADVTIAGVPDPATGMIVDTGLLERNIEGVRRALDHKFLNRVESLGVPTLENLARYIWDRLGGSASKLARVTVARESCNEACSYHGPAGEN